MPGTDVMNDRIEALETHILSVEKERPGLMLRVDRLEWFVKALIALVTLGVAWKVVDVAGQFIASQALRP